MKIMTLIPAYRDLELNRPGFRGVLTPTEN